VPLKVNEIFYSIQGESSYAGRPCVFVRLTGCNLRCSYCDTQYAYDKGDQLEIDQIVRRVLSHHCRLVEVTGGEPLTQDDAPRMIHGLLEQGLEVLLETNGSQDIGPIDGNCVKIIDIKCPSSGEEGSNDFRNLNRLTEKDEIKFVIGCREDYAYAKKLLGTRDFTNNKVHFSPVSGKMDPKILAEWILHDHLDVRLQLQLQKIIWGPEKTGV